MVLDEIFKNQTADRGSSAEFLSGFHKDDKLTPVITITVYWGSGKWDAPRSLHEMFGDIDERLIPFIPDYRINLVIPDEIEDFDIFSTELGEVLEFIKVSADKKEMETLLNTNKKLSVMSSESVNAINIFTGMNIPVNEKEGVTDMCKAWEEQKNEFPYKTLS